MGQILSLDDCAAFMSAIPPGRRAWFALVCTERLVARTRVARQAELRSALDAGWQQVRSGGDVRAVESVVASLDSENDIDEDAVAAVALALESVLGDSDAAEWAVGRSIDAAMDAVPYPSDAREFRPLDVDLADPTVQSELRWQSVASVTVSEVADADSLYAWVRSDPPPWVQFQS